SAYEVILMDREVRGVVRKLLVHMNKSGLTFVLDRGTGEYMGAFSVPEVQTWMAGFDNGKVIGRNDPQPGKPISIWPSALGAKSWNQMSYSPRTGLIYLPAVEACNDITASRQEPREGRGYAAGSFKGTLPPGRDTYAHVDAFDPITGKRVWSVAYKYV